MANYEPYESNQDAIEAVLRYVCRKELLNPDWAEEFSQWTRLKLIENDCAILRSFEGTCPFKNFLVAVVINKYKDWLDSTRGKFRVSAPAKKLGPVAEGLERLIVRDQLSFGEAAQLLVSKGVAASDQECDEVWGQLNRAPRRVFVTDEFLENREGRPSPDPMEHEERQRLTRKVHAAMVASLAALPRADNLILRLKYWDRVSVANIAKLQQTEQKPLYRRIEQILKRLERDMAARGISEQEIRGLFDDLGIDPDDFEDEGGK